MSIETPRIIGQMTFNSETGMSFAAAAITPKLKLLPRNDGGGHLLELSEPRDFPPGLVLDPALLSGGGLVFYLEGVMPKNDVGSYGAVQLRPRVLGTVCMKLTKADFAQASSKCGDINIGSTADDPKIYALKLNLTGGGIRPLDGAPFPDFIQKALTIRADPKYPFLMDMELDLNEGSESLKFDFSAAVVFNLPALGITNLLLDASASGFISEANGMSGAFALSIPQVTLPAFLGGPLKGGVVIAIATAEGRTVRIEGEMAVVRKGLSQRMQRLEPTRPPSRETQSLASTSLMPGLGPDPDPHPEPKFVLLGSDSQ